MSQARVICQARFNIDVEGHRNTLRYYDNSHLRSLVSGLLDF